MRSYSTGNKPPKQTLEFELDGRVFKFTPPSWAPFLLAAQSIDLTDAASMGTAVVTMLDWLGAGLSNEDGEFILKRLKDSNDPFDVDDATEIVFGIIQEVTQRPTGRPSDSSESPLSPSSTAGAQPEMSTLPDSVFADSAI